MRTFFTIALALCLISSVVGHASEKEKEGSAWADIKKGTRTIVKGAGKGIKKVGDKIKENMEEDEREESSEGQGKKKK